MKDMKNLWTAGVLACVLLEAGDAAAQDAFVLEGRLVEQADGAPIRGATVELPGRPPIQSGESGDFRFENVPRGRYTLNVEALGYEPVAIELILQSDTTVRIEMSVRPVALDSVEARARFVTFRGRVVDADSSKPIYDADVHLGLDRRTTTNANGGFRFGRVAALAPNTIEVRALGFMPVQRVIEAVDDTMLAFALEPDPIAVRMIEQQLTRLQDRLDAVPYSTVTMDREDIRLYRNWTAREVLESRVRLGLIGCLIIDEMPIDDRGILTTYMPAELERIEILRNSLRTRGVSVRIYTRRFLQRMVAGGIQLRRLPTSRISLCN